MPRIDFVISNDGHHASMILPVVSAMSLIPDYRCRIVSLCEFRGLISPVSKFQMPAVEFVKALPFRFRFSSSGGRQTGTSRRRTARSFLRNLSWELFLGQRLRKLFSRKADLVVVPNDTAFPYDKLCSILRDQETPFLLIQEGIRFPLPKAQQAYGTGGATAIAAWGESSAEYFLNQGVPDDHIHRTGNPRFDSVLNTDWHTEGMRFKAQLGLRDTNLLYLSNPIDDQGFCTTEQKMELFRAFLDGIRSLFNDEDFSLIVKLHSRESLSDFEGVVRSFPFAKSVRVLSSQPLYPLFTVSSGAVVLASTVGLEALFFGVPLGILEIPGTGFVYDYVERKAAIGLTVDSSLAEQVRMLLHSPAEPDSVNVYISRNLATLENSTGRVVSLIRQIAEKQELQCKLA